MLMVRTEGPGDLLPLRCEREKRNDSRDIGVLVRESRNAFEFKLSKYVAAC